MTKHDIINQEYKITKKRKSRMYNLKDEKVLTSSKMRISLAEQGEAGGKRIRQL